MQSISALFTHYTIAGVQTSLDRIQAAAVVSEADRQQAWHILSFALNTPGAWPATRALLLALAPKMEQAGFREEWIPYLEKGLYVAQSLDDVQTVAECELQIGLLYRLLSRFAESRRWLWASLKHFEDLSYLLGQVRAYNELAWQAHLVHQYEEASAYLDKILPLYRSNSSIEFQVEQAVSYRIQGMIAMGQRNWSQAEQLHNQALQLFQVVGDIRRSAWSLQNIGYALNEQGRIAEAIKYFTQAEQTLMKIGDYYHRSIAQMNLGIAYQRAKEPDLALICFANAQDIFCQYDDKLNLARIFTNIGLVSLDKKDYSKAQTAFIQSAAFYKELGDMIWHINALDGLALALIGSLHYEQASQILRQAISLLPEIQGTPYYENLRDKLVTHLDKASIALL